MASTPIEASVQPGEAHWRAANVERAGAIIKDSLSGLDRQVPPSTSCQELASLVCSAFSDTVSVRGASPFELILGRRPDDFLKAEYEDDVCLGTTWHPEQNRANRLELKRRAWQAVLDSTFTASVRRAHLAKTWAKTIWHPGEMVYDWRSSGRGGSEHRG